MKDKRIECGCHVGCTTTPHQCERPCRWPDCLTEAEEADLLRAIRWMEMGGSPEEMPS